MKLNENKISTHEINKLRSKYLIPGSEINLGANESKIPILLIQTTSETNFRDVKNGTMFTGWDIIIPNSWATSFLQLFIHLGNKIISINL
jgi:ribonuclease P/MRP protein subunit POP1